MTLKDLRKNSNLTQAEVAKKVGLTSKFISDMEMGRRNPSDKSKEKLAKVYNVTPTDIFVAYYGQFISS